MPYGVTPTGFNRPSLQEIRQRILNHWLANVSTGIDTSDEGLEAQFAGGVASEIDAVWAAQEAEFAARDPAQAEGQALDDLLALKGAYRLPPQESLVGVNVNLDPGVYPAGSLVVTVDGDPTARFANDVEITAPGGLLVGQVFRSEETGPVRANAGTLTAIVPTVGFNSATNPTDAVLGNNGEMDADFFARAETETATYGSATADAVRAEIGVVPDVTFVRVYVNDNQSMDANGVQGNSVEAVVRGGADQDIRDAILRSKAGGIRASGSSLGSAVDSQGNVYDIRFTRPTELLPYVTVEVDADEGLYPGDAVVETLLLDWFDTHLNVGQDVVRAQIMRLVMELPGVYDVRVFMGTSPSPVGTGNYVVGVRQYANLDSTRVIVTHVAATGPA